MKYLNRITAALLGLVFIVFGANFFLHFIPIPKPPEGSPAAMFMGGMFVSGMLAFVKVLEILGGMLMAKFAGIILETVGSFQPIFIVASCAYLLALLVLHLIVPRYAPVTLSQEAA